MRKSVQLRNEIIIYTLFSMYISMKTKHGVTTAIIYIDFSLCVRLLLFIKLISLLYVPAEFTFTADLPLLGYDLDINPYGPGC